MPTALFLLLLSGGGGGIALDKDARPQELSRICIVAWDGRNEMLITRVRMRSRPAGRFMQVVSLPSQPTYTEASPEVFSVLADTYNLRVERFLREESGRQFGLAILVAIIWLVCTGIVAGVSYMAIRKNWGVFKWLTFLAFAAWIALSAIYGPAYFPLSLGLDPLPPLGMTEGTIPETAVLYSESPEGLSDELVKRVVKETESGAPVGREERRIVERAHVEGLPHLMVSPFVLEPAAVTIGPVQLTFETEKMMVPLRWLSRIHGKVALTVLILTKDPGSKLTSRGIRPPHSWRKEFVLTPGELKSIDPGLEAFFGTDSAYLRAFSMELEAPRTDGDLIFTATR
jgi:hypothetical protein